MASQILKNDKLMDKFDPILRQQIYRALDVANFQRQMNIIPRLHNVILSQCLGSTQYYLSVRLKFLLLKTRTENFTEIVIRIPRDYPATIPNISCATGADAISTHIEFENSFSSACLGFGGWSTACSIEKFAIDFLSRHDSCALSDVRRNEDDEKDTMIHCLPSAPTYYPSLSNPVENKAVQRFKCPVCLLSFEKEYMAVNHYMKTHIEKKLEARKLTIKCWNGKEYRRFLILDDISFSHLVDMVKRIFIIRKDINLSYKDSDGDYISIASDEELQEAIYSRQSDLLLLHVDADTGVKIIPTAKKCPYTYPEIQYHELDIGAQIGSGSTCQVYKAQWKGKTVALKKMLVAELSPVKDDFDQEVKMMTRIGCHPNIVLLVGVCYHPKCLAFEYLACSLFDLINRRRNNEGMQMQFPSEWCTRLSMMMDICSGLQFLHSFNIIHRDLKSLNLLVSTDARVKISDFGLARISDNSNLMTGCLGTFQYMAPEVITSQKYSISADVYSLGIVFWEIIEARSPYMHMNPMTVAFSVVNDNLRPAISASVPQPLRILLGHCWHRDKKKRPSIEYVSDYILRCHGITKAKK